MKRVICYPFMLVFMVALMLTAGFAAAQSGEKPPEGPGFLYVLTAKGAEIEKVGGDQYTLTLRQADVDHVLQFSDRPYRLAKYISAEELVKSWSVGKNSFEKDPPNAALVAHGLKQAVVIELRSVERAIDSVSYRFSMPKTEDVDQGETLWMNKSRRLEGQVSLFIDKK